MKIALFPNLERQGTNQLMPRILEILGEADCVLPEGADFGRPTLPEEELYKACDIILTVGGDGTLIKHAKEAALYGKPCIGINTGRLGFLADIEPDSLDCLSALLKGQYTVEPRMMLAVKAYKNGECVYSDIALNDAVVSSGTVARITDLKLTVSGHTIEYRADGLIISTPTGSTAYSMSAGGPVIDPAVRCLTVTPVCSHSLTARPLLAAEASELTVELLPSSRTDAFLTIDGQRCVEVGEDTVVKIKRAPYDALLINATGSSIFKTLSKKF
ncbi:MAG: NAD(+)/NADH kinase [Clostridia bacterium]|nr:NAD(+)/NADH kinase [Clostridia bacterium]